MMTVDSLGSFKYLFYDHIMAQFAGPLRQFFGGATMLIVSTRRRIYRKPLLWKMAASDETVNIFDRKSWGGGDYQPLKDMVCSRVVPHVTQNQRVENLVQAAALVRQTNVGES